MTETRGFKQLGATGVLIPELGLGTWRYHAGPEPLRRGLEAGALFIDTAESYGNEEIVAQAVGNQRARVFLATKVSPAHFRRSQLLKAADASLLRLGTDHIDLYQLHSPNDDVPLEETLGTMEDLVDAGKVRFIGVSNFSVAELEDARRAMRRHPIASNQVRFNLIDRTIVPDLLPYCREHGITIIAYSPLARGFRHILDCDPDGMLSSIATAIGRTPVQVALNWCLHQDGVVAIPKGNSVEHVLENCGASGWRLSAEQVRQLDDRIVFRRRSAVEIALRRYLPPGLKRGVQQVVQLLPPALRRKLT
jgi:diketogulonate reductase-like aldo/keto reductase